MIFEIVIPLASLLQSCFTLSPLLKCVGFKDLIFGSYGQHHVNCDILFFRFRVCFLIFEHLQGCLPMWVIKNLMIKTTTNKTKVLSGNIIDFVIPISFIKIFGCFRLSRHFIHKYVLFLLQLVVWVFWVPMATSLV